jgi:hypothetical protein
VEAGRFAAGYAMVDKNSLVTQDVYSATTEPFFKAFLAQGAEVAVAGAKGEIRTEHGLLRVEAADGQLRVSVDEISLQSFGPVEGLAIDGVVTPIELARQRTRLRDGYEFVKRLVVLGSGHVITAEPDGIVSAFRGVATDEGLVMDRRLTVAAGRRAIAAGRAWLRSACADACRIGPAGGHQVEILDPVLTSKEPLPRPQLTAGDRRSWFMDFEVRGRTTDGLSARTALTLAIDRDEVSVISGGIPCATLNLRDPCSEPNDG